MQRLSVHKNHYLVAAICWTLAIAVLCLVSFRELPSIGIGGADKYVHFILHFGYTLLWFLYFNKKNPNVNKVLLKTMLSSVVYGILIEIAQGTFTATRQADVYDVLANSSGTVGAAIVILAYFYYFKKR